MIHISAPVRAALQRGEPIVALESTVISHGLPYPHNQELAYAMEAEIRAAGALPATIGVVAGIPTVGMEPEQIAHFARSHNILKLSRRDIAYAMTMKRDGATTVAATMALAAAADIAIFATGGIGGIHRGARESWDISADLTELARTPVLVVCAGAKAILDLPATLEYLETIGVPVVGLATDEFPAFYSAHSGLAIPARIETAAQAALLWRNHRSLTTSGMLVTIPPPSDVALPPNEAETAIERALTRATAQNIRGQAVTPFLLAAVAEETHGESMRSNIALLRQNARIAATIAHALATTES